MCWQWSAQLGAARLARAVPGSECSDLLSPVELEKCSGLFVQGVLKWLPSLVKRCVCQ